MHPKSQTKTFVCIYNPVSGRGHGGRLADDLCNLLKELGHEARAIETVADPQAFKSLCSSLTAQDRVVCIGGDGTLLYFLNQNPQFHSVAFYGMGTANVIAIEFDLPKNLEAFARMLIQGKTTEIFPGKLQNGMRFLMMCSLGVDGYILSHVSQRLKNRFGKAAFLPVILKAAWSYPFPKIELEMEGGERLAGHFVVISRFRNYGGPHVLAGEADPTSDHLQITVIEGKNLWQSVKALYGIFIRKKDGKGVRRRRTPSVRIIEGETPHYAQLDGDAYPGDLQRITVADESFPLVIP